MKAAAAQLVPASIPDVVRHRLKRRLWIGIAAGGILAGTTLIWGLNTPSTGLSYVVVGPIATKTGDSTPGEQNDPWAVARELNAMFASDSMTRVVDPRTVRNAAATITAWLAGDELTTEEWIEVATSVGASELVLDDLSGATSFTGFGLFFDRASSVPFAPAKCSIMKPRVSSFWNAARALSSIASGTPGIINRRRRSVPAGIGSDFTINAP